MNPVRNRARASAPEGPTGRAISNGMKKAVSFSIALWIVALLLPLFAHAQYYYPSSYNSSYYQMPQMYWCGSYYSYSPCTGSNYSNYSYHNFSPYTYVNTSPYVNVNAPQYTSAAYSYPSYSSPYAPSSAGGYGWAQQGYGGTQYSYPSYSYSYPSYSYSYPSYTYPTYYYDYYDYYSYSYPQYQSYSYPSYSYDYWYDSYDGYCYSGYGCYPMYVADPHQWLYDPWTGNWY